MKKLIILEINEIPFKVFDHYIKLNPDSVLSNLLSNSKQYITISTDQGELHPWSTWPTFYRGVDNTKHKIKDIGEDLSKRNLDYPPVWEILARNQVSVGIFSSLHTYPLPANTKYFKFVVPDPFANGANTLPKAVQPFQEFNLSMTKRSGRSVDRGIDKKGALKMLLVLPNLGLRLSTIFTTIQQLISELFAPWKASRRRTFQSVLAFDIFLKLLKKEKPQFVTFFSNHVASAMHRYWAASFPEDYQNHNLPVKWVNRYKHEIDFCMDQLNRMVKSVVKFISKNPEYKLIIASSMGQAATKAEMVTHELFLDDYDKLGTTLGIPIKPVSAMHPQYNFLVDSSDAEQMDKVLSTLSINDRPVVYRRKENTFFSLDLGYPNVKSFSILLSERRVHIHEIGFSIKKIDDLSGGTAYHIPEGCLFIYDYENQNGTKERTEIDLREVAPAILNYFDISTPSYMKKNELIKF